MAVMPSLEERLSAAAADIRERDLARERLDTMQGRVDEASHAVASAKAAHSSEMDDIERLERVTFSRLFASIVRSRDDKLERERAEADAARHKVDQARAHLAAVTRDRDAARAKLEALADAPRVYEQVLYEKQQLLRDVGDPRATKLFDMADEEGTLRGEINELSDAVDAAAAADRALRDAAVKLDSASKWSDYDTYFGGGAMASSAKHTLLDEAADAALRADETLSLLRTELADVAIDAPAIPDLSEDGGSRFMDIWFDNIFTDLAVGDRIAKSQREVALAASAVADIAAGLARHAARTRDRLRQIDVERSTILLSPPAENS